MNSIFTIYYLLTLAGMLAMLYSYRRQREAIFLILLAFKGPIAYFLPRGAQLSMVLYLAFALYLFVYHKAWTQFQQIRKVVVAFALFSLYFLVDNIVIGTDYLFLFSQYARYLIPFLGLMVLLCILRKERQKLYFLNVLVGDLLWIQCVFGMAKWALMGGHFFEGMVGTFGTMAGGGAGTGFPLVALCWMAINTNMRIRGWKAWLIVLGLLFVGVATGKRAVIVLYPLLFLLLSVYVCRQQYSRQIWGVLLLVPLMFYLGVRLTPTLNPDDKVWGRFDIDYALDYAKRYSGVREQKTTAYLPMPHMQEEVDEGGRLGSVRVFWQLLTNPQGYTRQVLLGEGVERAYTSMENREAYDAFGREYGLNHRGDLTGIFFLFIAIGMIGVLLFLLYYVLLFWRIVRYRRLCVVLLGLVLFDFIFYNTTIIREPFINILLLFSMVLARLQYTPQGTFVGYIHPLLDNDKNR